MTDSIERRQHISCKVVLNSQNVKFLYDNLVWDEELNYVSFIKTIRKLKEQSPIKMPLSFWLQLIKDCVPEKLTHTDK